MATKEQCIEWHKKKTLVAYDNRKCYKIIGFRVRHEEGEWKYSPILWDVYNKMSTITCRPEDVSE